MAVSLKGHNEKALWGPVDFKKTCGYTGKRFEDQTKLELQEMARENVSRREKVTAVSASS
jgi:hypothetical protein